LSHAPLVGVAGLGLIGASIGLRAAACGWRVIGWDPDAEHARVALERGAVASLLGTFDALAADAQTLVLAAPLDATVRLLGALAAGLPSRASLIVDVASVKAPVARAGATLGAFVPTHPIAGSERSGPQAAHADLFVESVWMYDPMAAADAAGRARAFIEAMGALPYPVGSVEHDRIVALTSHLPQLVSVALGARLGPALAEPRVLALCGAGVRAMLRLGTSSWPMWRAIVAANGVPVAQEVRRLADVLSSFADALDGERPDVLADSFVAAAGAVARLGANVSAANPASAASISNDERQSWIDGPSSAPL